MVRHPSRALVFKVPDIYDCIKYDLQHNQNVLPKELAEELHTYAKSMADVVIPQVGGGWGLSQLGHSSC